MSKIVVVGANHAGTACINTMLDNFGNENEIVVFDQNSNISFLGCGMALWIGEQIDGPEGLFYSDKEKLEAIQNKLKTVDIAKTSTDLNVGEMTLTDIIEELSKPGRDPREDMPKPILRSDVLKLEDLKEGMVLTGTVRNVIDFGAFVDIGVKHDGLVHISEMSEKFIKNPSDIVSVGDVVKVKVIKIDKERQKVGLSMKV